MIACTKSPTFHLAKHTHSLLQKTYKYTENRSLKNLDDLIEKLKNETIPDTATLISFDVTSMYTHIPTKETIHIIERHLQSQGDMPAAHIQEISTILKLVTEQNYFSVNNKFYSQQEGLPMGSPISGLLANIFMNHIENNIFDKIVKPKQYKIQYWYRYVDDIICLVDEPHTHT